LISYNFRDKNVLERFVKAFLDVVVLLVLRNKGPLSGYRIIESIYELTGVFIAPSVLYPTIYQLRAKGFISKYEANRRGGVFILTDQGNEQIEKTLQAFLNLQNLISFLSSSEIAGKRMLTIQLPLDEI